MRRTGRTTLLQIEAVHDLLSKGWTIFTDHEGAGRSHAHHSQSYHHIRRILAATLIYCSHLRIETYMHFVPNTGTSYIIFNNGSEKKKD